ncbi:hypothetical protein [Vibrio coralliilyticus]|uniref:hypothetical protein n=1 Tax=Vibrio coralliilyticus TaxID=190893 RepID=UPI0006CCE8F2|nr:hypothetical protein [Vibrio coralliilyticus]AXN30192.1 hypothetical protein DVV14_02310 [Vibrio coralliilyticus]KPH25314.1 hypothetical protein ADU60_08585 [Vibrio coralliilyticus]
MIQVELPLDDNIELLLEAIGHERQELLNMELAEFLQYRDKGYFTRTKYRLSASADMNAHIEVSISNNDHLVLVLQPRTESAQPELERIIRAFNAARGCNGIVEPKQFSQGISEEAARGVREYLNKNV